MISRKFNVGALLVAFAVLTSGPLRAEESRIYTYRAVEGDTLIKLANRFLIKKNEWQVLQKHNTIENPNRIPVGTSIRIPVSVMRTEAAPAVVTASRGRVESSARSVAPGLVVSEGDTLKTGDDGFVTIKLADGSTLTVQSKSSVRMETARQFSNTGGVADTVVRLDAGRLETRAAIQKGPAARYEIRTPTSNMGVRGTVFRVGADDTGKKGQSEVIEGLVGVEATTIKASAIELPAGFGSIAEAGKPPSQPVALLPPPDLAALAAEFTRPEIKVAFPPVVGAVAYRAQVGSDRAFTNMVADVSSAESSAAFAGLPDGELYFRARGIDNLGLEGKDAIHVFRVKARPFAPALQLPLDNARLGSGQAKFSWQPAPEASAYRVQIAEQADFSKPVVEKTSLTLPVLVLDAPLKSGAYVWRVASLTAKGDAGPWGDIQRFEVRATAPQLKPKRDSKKIILELDNGAIQPYQVQVARDERFVRIVSDGIVRGPEADLSSLSQNVYYVRIRAVTPGTDAASAATSDWSESGMLEVYANDWWLSTYNVPARR